MAKSVMGVTAPTPRPTLWAAIYAIGYLGLPMVAVLALLDVALYLVFRHLLGVCYGITCFFG